MSALLHVLSILFWGVVLLSPLVFLHEGGHFLAARACGVRVTEFFLGLPFRFNLSHVSKRSGTRFGVTPLLLGGYAMISGMDPETSEFAPGVLRLVHQRGRATVAELAQELSISEDDASAACAMLLGWGSLAPVYRSELGEHPQSRYYPSVYAAMPRDGDGRTIFDGRRFGRAHATAQGEAWDPPMGERAFFEAERSRTYLGVGFWKRTCMLLAGIFVNIVSGILMIMCVYSIIGVTTIRDGTAAGAVGADSVAQRAGVREGDRIVSVDGHAVRTWNEILAAIRRVPSHRAFRLEFDRGRTRRVASVRLGKDGLLGIEIPTRVVHLNPVDAAKLSVRYLALTLQAVGRLIQPAHTLQVLDSSTSIVGISIISAQAAAAGAASFLQLAGVISFSLGIMNLLPVPPLDGGRLLIEIIQALTRRHLSLKVQNAISLAGVAALGAAFIYLLRGDILRFFF